MGRYLRHFGGGGQDALEITYTGNGSATFDPSFTTSKTTTMSLVADDGTVIITAAGTSHAFSYVPSTGPHRCVIKCAAGLGVIATIICDSDSITAIKGLRKLNNITQYLLYTNPGLVLDIGELASPTTTRFWATNCSAVYGRISAISSRIMQEYYLSGCPLVTGTLADFASTTAQIQAVNNTNLTGSLPDISSVALTTLHLNGCTGLTAGSLAAFVAARDFRIFNMGWNQAAVDLVIDSIYQAVVADANHYTYATPALQIGANNAAPSGIYQLATPPTTGLEKVYYLCHLPAHAWTISWNGGAGP